MFAKRVAYTLAGALIAGGLVSSAQAAWMDPTGGWQYDYEASSNALPAAGDGWTTGGYQTGTPSGNAYTGIVTDSQTSELAWERGQEQTGSTTRKWENTTGAALVGGIDDKVTIDLRIRIASIDQDNPTGLVTALYFQRKTSSTTKDYYLGLGPDTVQYYNGSGATTVSSSVMGTGWHNLRLLVDTAANTMDVYFDGLGVPYIASAGLNDGSAAGMLGVYQYTNFSGKAEIAYLKITNGELASVVPEPASLSLLALGASSLLIRRRRSIA